MENGIRIIALSTATSLIVSLLVFGVVQRNMQPAEVQSSTAIDGNLTSLEESVHEESPIINVVERAEPAVASVIISKDLPIIQREFDTGPLGINLPGLQQGETERLEIGGGTAFFITPDGLMLTNKHVVGDPDAQYTVLLNDGQRLEARVVARDFLTDIALLRVQGNNFPYLALAENDDPTLGQTVIAIGNALAEFRNTVSIGVISGLQRTITAANPAEGTAERLSQIIQTDAAINEGNSGGPLLNLRGEVIGMNTALASQAQNIGFAIPVADLERVTKSFQQYGRIVRPYLGVRYTAITQDIAQLYDLPYSYGVVVTKPDNSNEPAVIPGSPAEKAGIQQGDVILEADGERLTEEVFLSDIIQRKQPGDSLKLTIERNGEDLDITVKLEEWNG